MKVRNIALWFVVAGGMLLVPAQALAHCDSLDGPVVKAAQKALDTGSVAHVLIWVREADEPEIRAAFTQAFAVRALTAEAKALADRYFFETVVRVHRAGEGAPYTGLVPAGATLGPAIEAAEQAIADRSPVRVFALLDRTLEAGLHASFEKVMTTRTFRPDDVHAGREHVAAYVAYIHYVERLYEESVHAARPHQAPH